MISFPNAKINLGLHVVSRRTDGYHNIETVFYPVGLKDALEIVPSDSGKRFRFFPDGLHTNGKEEDNLVVKAWRLLSMEREIPAIDIHLLKKIPFGAGLGGGSSDAAFMLKLLNDTFLLGYSDEELMARAAKLGADCPFFIKNRPALATGIGDQLEEVTLDLGDYTLMLVKPPLHIDTREAYSMITPVQPEFSPAEIIRLPVRQWKGWLKNDFERPLFQKYPVIKDIKDALYNLGAIYASMSGSGSALYALFDKETTVSLTGLFDDCFVWSSCPD